MSQVLKIILDVLKMYRTFSGKSFLTLAKIEMIIVEISSTLLLSNN